MRKALILLTATAALTACSSTPDAATQPGSPAVYERISSTDDCAALQQEFDTASANHDRAAAGSDEATTATAYMKAAQDRMETVGC